MSTAWIRWPIQRMTGTLKLKCPKPARANTHHAIAAAASKNAVVMISDGRSPITRPKKPAMIAPSSGRNTIRSAAVCIRRVSISRFPLSPSHFCEGETVPDRADEGQRLARSKCLPLIRPQSFGASAPGGHLLPLTQRVSGGEGTIVVLVFEAFQPVLHLGGDPIICALCVGLEQLDRVRRSNVAENVAEPFCDNGIL